MRTGTPTDFTADSLKPFLAINAELDSGDVRLWGGYGEITIGGEEYTGGGTLLSISPVEETSEIAARGASVVLSGLDAAIISMALSEDYQGRYATIFIGTLAEDGTVEDTYTLFKGRLDQMSIEESGETASVAVTIENRLIDLDRPRARRYTNEDQIALYPGDTMLSRVNDLQEKSLDWGKSTTA